MIADGERNGGNTKGLALVAARTLAEHCEYLIYTAASFLYKEHKQYQSTSHSKYIFYLCVVWMETKRAG